MALSVTPEKLDASATLASAFWATVAASEKASCTPDDAVAALSVRPEKPSAEMVPSRSVTAVATRPKASMMESPLRPALRSSAVNDRSAAAAARSSAVVMPFSAEAWNLLRSGMISTDASAMLTGSPPQDPAQELHDLLSFAHCISIALPPARTTIIAAARWLPRWEALLQVAVQCSPVLLLHVLRDDEVDVVEQAARAQAVGVDASVDAVAVVLVPSGEGTPREPDADCVGRPT